MVAALRLSKRWEMWDMSSPRDPRRTDLHEHTGQGEKSRIRTSNMLHKILESNFFIQNLLCTAQTLLYGFFMPFHKDLSHGIIDTVLYLVISDSSDHA